MTKLFEGKQEEAALTAWCYYTRLLGKVSIHTLEACSNIIHMVIVCLFVYSNNTHGHVMRANISTNCFDYFEIAVDASRNFYQPYAGHSREGLQTRRYSSQGSFV